MHTIVIWRDFGYRVSNIPSDLGYSATSQINLLISDANKHKYTYINWCINMLKV